MLTEFCVTFVKVVGDERKEVYHAHATATDEAAALSAVLRIACTENVNIGLADLLVIQTVHTREIPEEAKVGYEMLRAAQHGREAATAPVTPSGHSLH